MNIQQRPQSRFPNAATAPRFSGVESNVIERALFPAAQGFLTMSQTADSFFNKHFLNDKASALPRLFGTIFGPIASVLGKQDYHEIARLSIPKMADFGRIVVEPPKGALVVLLFGFTLMGRLSHALKRAIGGDKRELRDILFRDIPTFTIILFALDPVMKKLSMMLEKRNGIQLVKPGAYKAGQGWFNNVLKKVAAFNNAEVFTYSQLEDVYRVSSKNKLTAILNKPQNYKGVLQAINGTLDNPTLSIAMRQNLQRFRNQVQLAMKAFKTGGESKTFNSYISKAFTSLERLSSLRDRHITKLAKATKAADVSFLSKWMRGYAGQIPAFKDMFLSYAKNSRVWSNVAAYGIQIAILGVGIPLFNKWYTEREFAQQQQQKGQV